MYKLCIFNFLITFCTAFLLKYPRKWVGLTFSSSCNCSCCFSLYQSWLSFQRKFKRLSCCGSIALLRQSSDEKSLVQSDVVVVFYSSESDRLLWEKYPSSLLARWAGKQSFAVPFNVLDLVYSQTVSWVGLYYCPLLPLIGTVTLTATFYIKKVVDVFRFLSVCSRCLVMWY